jgi:hypothetical protein
MHMQGNGIHEAAVRLQAKAGDNKRATVAKPMHGQSVIDLQKP